jgi:hypothetical protein
MSASVRTPATTTVLTLMLALLAFSSSVAHAQGPVLLRCGSNTWQHTIPRAVNRTIPIAENTIGNSSMRWAAIYNRATWDQRTSMTLTPTDFWSSAVFQFDGNYGPTSWVGLMTPNACPSTSAQIQYNHYYIGGNTTIMMSLACHEQGHAFGLDHPNNASSCMWAGAGWPLEATAGEYNTVSYWYYVSHP